MTPVAFGDLSGALAPELRGALYMPDPKKTYEHEAFGFRVLGFRMV